MVGVDTLRDATRTYEAQQMGQVMAAFQADFPASMKDIFERLAGPTVSLTLQEWIVEEGRKANPEVAVALLGDFARVNIPDLLREAGVPVRVINAAAGPTNGETQIEVNRQYADYDGEMMDDVGHFLQLEQPQRFNERLANLLARLQDQG